MVCNMFCCGFADVSHGYIWVLCSWQEYYVGNVFSSAYHIRGYIMSTHNVSILETVTLNLNL